MEEKLKSQEKQIKDMEEISTDHQEKLHDMEEKSNDQVKRILDAQNEIERIRAEKISLQKDMNDIKQTGKLASKSKSKKSYIFSI